MLSSGKAFMIDGSPVVGRSWGKKVSWRQETNIAGATALALKLIHGRTTLTIEISINPTYGLYPPLIWLTSSVPNLLKFLSLKFRGPDLWYNEFGRIHSIYIHTTGNL